MTLMAAGAPAIMASVSDVPHDSPERFQEIAQAIVERWASADEESLPPIELRDLASLISAASTPQQLESQLQRFSGVVTSAAGAPWQETALGHLIIGLHYRAREHLRSAAAKEALALCEEVRAAVSRSGKLSGHRNELVASLMVVEDSVCAIEGYKAAIPVAHVDEAYLAKYGLLQALQLGFDGAEAVARLLGGRIRADSEPGGKTVKIARNIVAGHPIGGSLAGEAWHHFHDRSSAHDATIIRVMSFSRDDPERWVGQTLETEQLIADGFRVITGVLRRALSAYA